MTGEVQITPLTWSALSEQVAAQLEGLILQGKVEVGSKLPTEEALARRFGVSRPVIREALAKLRDRALTETINGSGTYVRRPDGDHLTEVFLRHMRFGTLASPQMIDNVFEARIAVEVMAARLAASRRHDGDLRLISTRLEEMKLASESAAPWIAADMGFHLAVVDAARNPFLVALLAPMIRIIEQGISESWRDPSAVSSGLTSHEAIRAAITSRDGDRAAQAMLEHLQDAKTRLSSALVFPSPVRKDRTIAVTGGKS
jgi:DNA-binding FadR family transcriptional regulator